LEKLKEIGSYLNGSRPTAVNLSWAIERVLKRAFTSTSDNSQEIFYQIEDEAKSIHKEDIGICEGIGEHGESLIKDGFSIMTHCNAGALATTGIGTALAPIYKAKESGKDIKVYVDETRPLLQGSRLTAWELSKAGIETILQCDNMAAYTMSKRRVDIIITGTDRVATNGDIANKIGTLGVAIIAKHYNTPLFIAAPSSTIDFNIKSGDEIVIEQRECKEV